MNFELDKRKERSDVLGGLMRQLQLARLSITASQNKHHYHDFNHFHLTTPRL